MKSVVVGTCIVSLICTGTCVTLVYILDVCEERHFLIFFFNHKKCSLDRELLLPLVVPETMPLAVVSDSVKVCG